MEFKELRPGEILPPPPEGEEESFSRRGRNRLLVIERGHDGAHYEIMIWRPPGWERLVGSTNRMSIQSYAFLRPDKILEEVRARAVGDRGTAERVSDEAWAEEVAHGLAESALADNEGLRPCPFCGGPARIGGEPDVIDCAGECLCFVEWVRVFDSKRATAAWNARPIEDRLRKQIAKDHDQIRHLQQAEAEAMALVMAHKGRMESMGREGKLRVERLEKALADQREATDTWNSTANNWEQAYNLCLARVAELEKAVREAQGQWACAVEAQGMAYEGGRQEILASSPYLDLRELKDFISEAWGKEGEKTLDTLRRVKEGREELKKWWRVKEEAQTTAKEMLDQEKDGSDEHAGPARGIRSSLNMLLGHIEQAAARKETKE
jgi:hypothetical protein